MLTMIVAEFDEDYGGRTSYLPDHMTEERVKKECLRHGVPFTPEDLPTMAGNLCDSICGDWVVDIMPTVEFEKKQAEGKRQFLEKTASSLAQAHGVQVNSIEFLELLDSLIDRSRSYREGLREDGLCIGWGVNSEQWQEEYNASAGDEYRIDELKEWMVENLPLLSAQYYEKLQQEELS